MNRTIRLLNTVNGSAVMLLALWLPDLIIIPSAARADEMILLNEDFDAVDPGKLPAGWTPVQRGWQVDRQQLRGSAADAAAPTTILFEESNWRNVAIDADITFEPCREPAGWVGLLARYRGPWADNVQLTVRQAIRNRNGLEITVDQADAERTQPWRTLQHVSAPVDLLEGETHHVRFEAQGLWLRAYLNGEMVMNTPRADEVAPFGQIGFRAHRATVRIDNVRITKLEPPAPSALRRSGRRPLVIAHRGLAGDAPENTLAAFRQAVELGVDMAECDVRLSADRKVVLMHDARLDRTTNGKGKLDLQPWDALSRLDAGGWKAAGFAGEPIPLLTDCLKLTAGKTRLIIEIKERNMEREVLDAIGASGVPPEEVMVFSFHREVVKTIAEIEPRIPTTWLIDSPIRARTQRTLLRQALEARVSALGVPIQHVATDFLPLARQCGFPLYVWTVNDPLDMRFLVRIGVDGIITDRPDLLIDVLEEKVSP